MDKKLIDEIRYNVLRKVDDVILCNDEGGFFIVPDWATVGEITKLWLQEILPKEQFDLLAQSVRVDAKQDFMEYVKQVGLSAHFPDDFGSYRFKRYLKDFWHKVSRETVEEALDSAREQFGCRDVPNPIQMAEILADIDEALETNPLEGEWGFDDEYSFCNDCMCSIRTQPNCWDWTLPAWESDDGLVCPDCLDPGEYIEAMTNEVRNCNTYFASPADHGWTRLKRGSFYDGEPRPHRFQNGVHGGQTDDPEKQRDVLNAAGIDCLFSIYPSQFYVEWELWVPEGREEAAWAALDGGDVKADHDPADIMKAQLQAVSEASASKREGESSLSSGGETVNVPQEWIGRHPSCIMDPAYWIEFKRRHDALPQPVDDETWLRLAEKLDKERV